MQAAEKLMLDALQQRGFVDYDAFMRGLLHEELKRRDNAVAAQQLSLFPETLPVTEGLGEHDASLRAIYAHAQHAYGQINTLYAQLDEFVRLNERLCEKSAFVLGLTKEFRFIAFNAALRAARLGEEGRSLGVIAEYLGTASDQTSAIVGGLTAQIGMILGKLRAVIFNLAAARLQIEMVLNFCAELTGGRHDEAQSGAAMARSRRRMIEDLQEAFAATIKRAVTAFDELAHELRSMAVHSEEMRRMVLTLQVAQVGGLVEASRLRGDDSFTVMFADLRESVEKTKTELGALDDIGGRLGALANETPAITARISSAVEEMEQGVRGLATFDDVPQAVVAATSIPAPTEALELAPAAA
jgi:aerotaxis receptor